MGITDLLSDDGNTEGVRMALINVKGVLQDAAQDYARAALESANETLKCVQAADPCAVVWPHMYEYQQYTKKAYDAMNATTQATGMLLMAEQTGDDDIDGVNQDAKVTSMELHGAASMIEGANTRMTHAMKGVPNSGAPGQRCNPQALTPQPPPEKGS